VIQSLDKRTGTLWYCTECPASGVLTWLEGNPGVWAVSEALREAHAVHWLAIRILVPNRWKMDLDTAGNQLCGMLRVLKDVLQVDMECDGRSNGPVQENLDPELLARVQTVIKRAEELQRANAGEPQPTSYSGEEPHYKRSES